MKPAIHFTDSEKIAIGNPETQIYEKESEEKTKFLCPVHGEIDGARETYVNSVGGKVYHSLCSVCGWVKVQGEAKSLDGGRKPTSKIVCEKCGEEFFGEGRTPLRKYEKHLGEHLLREIGGGESKTADVPQPRKKRRRRREKRDKDDW